MAIEFRVTLEDKPGALARLCTTLGDAGVNIEAIQAYSLDGKGIVRFVPNQPDQAARALEAQGMAYSRREVLVVKVLDEPGMLRDVALVMSEAGINIDSVYITSAGHVVLGVDDLTGAIQVAGGMAVMIQE
ncbi:MAG: ACT domain-containing protein [Vicinamibacteria bacterium]